MNDIDIAQKINDEGFEIWSIETRNSVMWFVSHEGKEELVGSGESPREALAKFIELIGKSLENE